MIAHVYLPEKKLIRFLPNRRTESCVTDIEHYPFPVSKLYYTITMAVRTQTGSVSANVQAKNDQEFMNLIASLTKVFLSSNNRKGLLVKVKQVYDLFTRLSMQ
jgi:hypothetical protein